MWSDREAITATALDYAEGWYEGNAERMERALHPDLGAAWPSMPDAEGPELEFWLDGHTF